jgi:hypothetical protein
VAAPEQRQALALEGIKNYLGDLVRVMTAVNQNLVDFSKQIQASDEKYDELMVKKGDMMALIPRDAEMLRKNEEYALGELNENLAPEGYEFKKEPIETPCKGCGLAYCKIPECGSPEVDKKEGE